eukprot:UN10222
MNFFRKMMQLFIRDFLQSKFPQRRWICGMSETVKQLAAARPKGVGGTVLLYLGHFAVPLTLPRWWVKND